MDPNYKLKNVLDEKYYCKIVEKEATEIKHNNKYMVNYTKS